MDAIGSLDVAIAIADGEGVWSWHPWAGAKSAEDHSAGDGDYQVTDTGESTYNAVNTIAQGRPGVRLNLWLLTRVLPSLHTRLL
jgi:hypothetical protein